MKRLLLAPLAAGLLTSLPCAQTSLEFTHGPAADMHVDVANDPALTPSTGLTVEAWIQFDEAPVLSSSGFRWPTVLRMDPTPGQERYMMRVDWANSANRNFKFQVRTANSGSVSVIEPFTVGQLSTWTHVAGTYDGSNVKLYFDGVEVASAPASGPLVSSTDVLRIGNGDTTNAGAEVWSGRIEEVRIWPFARTAEELLAAGGQELSVLPGGAVTFNLNGNLQDSSSGLSATSVGGPTFVPSAPNLVQLFSSAGGFGASSSSCGQIPVAIGSVPQVGNASFRPRALNVTPGASGLFFAALNDLTVPFTVGGVAVYLDPSLIRVTIPTAGASSLGVLEAVAGLPNDAGLAFRSYFSQFLVLDPTCGSPNFTASRGLAITILP